MRVLVTRPERAAARTLERLRALGHDPVAFPVTAAEQHPQPVREALEKPHSAILVTSAEAVRVLRSLDDTVSRHLGETVFAVGEATATALRETGFSDVRIAEGTGASMIRLFGEEFTHLAATSPLLYLAGYPRSPALEAGLADLGAAANVVEAYRMHPIPLASEAVEAALRHPPADAVLFYSRETARQFFKVTTGDALGALLGVPLLCLSANVSEAIPESLHSNIRVAAGPDEESLLALL
nr:uroporphyrinogen III methyltransferase [Rhizobium sp. TCK]